MIFSTFRRILRSHIVGDINGTRLLSRTSTKCGKDEPPNKEDEKNAAKKLNLLLKSIVEDNMMEESKKNSFEVPKPRARVRAKKAAEKKETIVKKTLGAKIVDAAKDIAETVDGDKTKTEAELLKKLLHKGSPLTEDIAKAAPPSLNLSEVLAGVQIEKPERRKEPMKRVGSEMTRAEQVRKIIDRRSFSPKIQQPNLSKGENRVNLFASKPLGIFKNVSDEGLDIELSTWNQCHEREIHLTVTHPPANIYEQMIIWTERGMLWKFPIDNEQGLDDEKNVSFADHVFLETYLEDWCPLSGPIRHFMELVCVGLSRNHWLSAQEKKDHIEWYRDFFLSKKTLIKEIGAGDIQETRA